MVCRKCGADGLRRENRVGFLQVKIFPLLGLYPWECVICRKVGMYHKQFAESRAHVPLPESRNQGSLNPAQSITPLFNRYRKSAK